MPPLHTHTNAHTHSDKALLERLHVPCVNPAGEPKLINTEVSERLAETSKRKEQRCPTSTFQLHTHTSGRRHTLAVQTVLARACSLSSEPVKPSNQPLPSADSNQQEQPGASCIIYEGAEPSVLFACQWMQNPHPHPPNTVPPPANCHLSLCRVKIKCLPFFHSMDSVASLLLM